jgi:hypothetical protein
MNLDELKTEKSRLETLLLLPANLIVSKEVAEKARKAIKDKLDQIKKQIEAVE